MMSSISQCHYPPLTVSLDVTLADMGRYELLTGVMSDSGSDGYADVS